MNFLKRFGKKSPPSPAPAITVSPSFDLDTPLLYLSPADAWTVGDACEGVHIFGATGSGKTSGSGEAIAKRFLEHGFGGLVLCAKPDERETWERYAHETGTYNRLAIVRNAGEYRFNFLDYEMRRQGEGAGETENILNLFHVIYELTQNREGASAGNAFWEDSMKQLLRNAIELLKIGKSKETLSLRSISRLIASAPTAPTSRYLLSDLEDIEDEQMRKQVDRWHSTSFFAECVRGVTLSVEEMEAKGGNIARTLNDFTVAKDYWWDDYAELDERTRSNIRITFSSMADALQHGLAWELFGTDITIVPEVTYKAGTVIILDLSILQYGEVGRIVQGIFKYVFQRALLRRKVSEYPRPVFLWADEAHLFVTKFDPQYQSVVRSARGCTVFLTQNVNSYHAALGAHGKEASRTLLGNFQTKIFHANSDHDTNEYASDLIDKEWKLLSGTSTDNNTGARTQSTSLGVHQKLLSTVFTTLRTGGERNNRQVDAVIFRNGRIWNASGDTFLPATFTQTRK